jgi:uncharacterized protein YndB with AHSA1/START domain
MTLQIDPKLDLVLERTVDVPPEYVWRAWTEPELIKRWFTPAPWTTAGAEVDLRPGGIFRTIMRSPEGHEMDNVGCFLEVVPNRRLTWTGRLLPGFRPKAHDPSIPFEMTAIIALEPTASGGCKYTATVLHSDEKGREAHETMGFHNGWSAALDQLVAMYKAG